MTHTMRPNGSYLDRLVQLIPAEIVAAYLAVQGLVATRDAVRDQILEVSFVCLLLVLPFYLWRLHGVRSRLNILLTMGSFVVWTFVVSIPVYTRWSLDPVWGSVALILWTTVIPVFHIGERQQS